MRTATLRPTAEATIIGEEAVRASFSRIRIMPKRRATRTMTKLRCGAVPAGKWVKGVGPEMATTEVAFQCLGLRFETVLYWLPLAAAHPEEDIERVHQLRVSLRRALTNLRAFRALLRRRPYDRLRSALRAILKGAGAARDADVLLQRFHSCQTSPSPEIVAVVKRLEEERRAAQEMILSAYRDYPPGWLRERFEETLGPLRESRPKRGEKVEAVFGEFARRLLAPFAERFDAAYCGIEGDLADLHAFRVAGKKLRYSLEIVAGAFEKSRRREVYERLVSLQDYLGTLNDHYQMTLRFERWPEKDGLVEGILASERMIVADLQGLFAQWWPDWKHERFMESLKTLITPSNGK